ncbi:hypothetical protein HYDPIDRAFT_34257 [Hydnomerulius pinastri MD-312]|uniref:Uncharacterized protein n=1 Tax=Hydnomerulius pinastri MD-312 TaxID=994086 RepID=A0A0C9W7F2_9AGAM|nr:hypothetical protein HYDPIDRAFT_34257 [Hydnomerulius pinastri MD-312]
MYQWDLALEDANRAIELDPRSPLAYERTSTEKRNAIRMSIREAIKDWPPNLIKTQTGRICNRKQPELACEDLSPFKEYISSDTTTPQIHKSLIRAMKKYCRYIMLSHARNREKSVFDVIGARSVYDLSSPSYINKLQRF